MAKTPAKSAATPKAKAVKATDVVTESVMEAEAPEAKDEGAAGVLRLKTLVEEVMKSTGVKAKDVREIVLATLTAMGAALERGDGINLPEFGKGRVSRSSTDATGASALVLKLRRGGTPKKKEAQEALAEATE